MQSYCITSEYRRISKNDRNKTKTKRWQRNGTEWLISFVPKNKLGLNKVAMVLEENTLPIFKLNDKKIKT